MLHQKIVESPFKQKYGNFIGGQWREPVAGRYFDNTTPVTGGVLCQVARSDAADIELALDAAHAVREKWGRTSAAERSNILMKIAGRMEDNLELLARLQRFDADCIARNLSPGGSADLLIVTWLLAQLGAQE